MKRILVFLTIYIAILISLGCGDKVCTKPGPVVIDTVVFDYGDD